MLFYPTLSKHLCHRKIKKLFISFWVGRGEPVNEQLFWGAQKLL